MNAEIRNPNLEIRNEFKGAEMGETVGFALRASSIFPSSLVSLIVSDFAFRISNFPASVL